VRVGSYISSKISVISGVPQGSVLGPTLFLLYINDVADIFSDLSVSLSLFADDLKLYTCYKIDALHNDLHTAVNRLTEWAKLWQLQIAIPKCSVFRVFNPQWNVCESVQQLTYNIDDFSLPFADQIRDLGVHHDCRLKYDKHICLIVHNAYKRAVLILKCFHTRDREILKLAFCTYVRPLLEFACQIWSPKYMYLIDKIESVQRFFTRKLRGLRNLSYLDRLHVLDLETLEHRRLVHDLILCYKYLHGLIDTDNRHFFCVQLLPKTRNNGLKLYKSYSNIDARKTFFTNRVVDIWNCLPAAVVLSHNVSTFKRRLAKFNFSSFLHYI